MEADIIKNTDIEKHYFKKITLLITSNPKFYAAIKTFVNRERAFVFYIFFMNISFYIFFFTKLILKHPISTMYTSS